MDSKIAKKLLQYANNPEITLMAELAGITKDLERSTEVFSQLDLAKIEYVKGEKGDKGDKGEKGDSIQGPRGLQGTDGRPGRDGTDGKDGAPGKDAEPGKDGRDGALIDARILRDKLNELQGDERLDASQIKGIPTLEDIVNYIKNLRGNSRLDISNIRNAPFSKSSKASGGFNMDDQRWHGAGSGATPVVEEALAGAVDGVNKVFTAIHTPQSGRIAVYIGAARVIGGGVDYTIVAQTVTFNLPPPTQPYADYSY